MASSVHMNDHTGNEKLLPVFLTWNYPENNRIGNLQHRVFQKRAPAAMQGSLSRILFPDISLRCRSRIPQSAPVHLPSWHINRWLHPYPWALRTRQNCFPDKACFCGICQQHPLLLMWADTASTDIRSRHPRRFSAWNASRSLLPFGGICFYFPVFQT